MQEPERNITPTEPPPLMIVPVPEDGSGAPRLSARAIAAGAAIAGAAMLATPAASMAQGTSTTPSSTTPSSAQSSTLLGTVADAVTDATSGDASTDSGTQATSSTSTAGTSTSSSPTTTSTTSTTPTTGTTTTSGTTTTPTTGAGTTPTSGTGTTPTTGTGSGATTSGSGSGTGSGSGSKGSSGGDSTTTVKLGPGGTALGHGASSSAGSIGSALGVKPVKKTRPRHKPGSSSSTIDHPAKAHKHHAASAKRHGGGLPPLSDNEIGGSGFEFSPFPISGPAVPWGGSSIFESPFTVAQLQRFAQLAGDKVVPPSYLVRDYKAAARRYDIPWEVLAAINYIETGYGKDLAVSSAGAVGWMQFMPATWAQYGEVITSLALPDADRDKGEKNHRKHERKHAAPKASAAALGHLSPLGVAQELQAVERTEQAAAKAAARAVTDGAVDGAPNDASAQLSAAAKHERAEQRRRQALAQARELQQLFGAKAVAVRTVDGQPNPWNPTDAIFAAARMLAADGARKDMARAVYSYNHAAWYVQEVLTVAQKITTRELIGSRGKTRVHTKTAGAQSARDRLQAMRTEARLLNGIEYVWGGGHVDDNWLTNTGYDCSGFVSAVLHAGGYLKTPVATQTLPGQPGIEYGPGKYVTIYDRTDAGSGDDHVIIDLGGRWWESGGGSSAGGAGMVHRITQLSRGYLQSFNVVMHPKGL